MNIYVASSWRNPRQEVIVRILREVGYNIYDFKHPTENDSGFHWTDVWKQFDTYWREGTMEQFIKALEHPIAIDGFNKDMEALKNADVTILVMPCGRSAHLELGYAVGAKQHTAILLSDGEPELMYKMVDKIATSIGDIIVWLNNIEKSEN